MSKNETTMGFGLLMVDEKLPRAGIVLPPGRDLISFLDTQPNTMRETGGVTPNIVSTLASFAPERTTRLLGCVGQDSRGKFYQSRTNPQLGRLQTHQVEPTGVVASAIDDHGVVYARQRNLGAAAKATIGKDETETPPALFISDLTTLRLPGMFTHADRLLASLAGGNFFLNLAGLNPAIAPREELTTVLDNLSRQPDIVTSNESEFEYLTGKKVNPDTLTQVFPETRLFVLTLAEKGSLIRYEGQIIKVSPYLVQEVVDETGAGDTNAGVMLGVLYEKPYNQWTKDHVLKAAETAAYGSSLVVSTLRTRLTEGEMESVRRYNATGETPNN